MWNPLGAKDLHIFIARSARVFCTLPAAGRDDAGSVPGIFGAPHRWDDQHQVGDVWREPNLRGGQQPRGSADYWLQDPRSSKRPGEIPEPCKWWDVEEAGGVLQFGRRRDQRCWAF